MKIISIPLPIDGSDNVKSIDNKKDTAISLLDSYANDMRCVVIDISDWWDVAFNALSPIHAMPYRLAELAGHKSF